MALPKISIVTPSFNQGRFIERTILSVVAQSYPNLEYIIIDGGSRDGTMDIVKKYRHDITHWVSEKDRGQTHAIEKGFSRATGDILAYLNSDDILLKGALVKVAQALDPGKPQWIVGWQKIINTRDQVIVKRPILPFTLSDLWFNKYIIPQEATFFTRKIYDQIGGFDTSYDFGMDMHAWLRMASLCPPLILKEYLACFRVHRAQKSMDVAAHIRDWQRAVKEVALWRQEFGMAPQPPRPKLAGPAYKLLKALFYLVQGGPPMLKQIYLFRKTYRNTPLNQGQR